MTNPKKLLRMLLCLLSASVALNGHAQRAARVDGTVYEAGRQPLTGATISVADFKFGAVTDINGRYQLNHVPQGKVRLVVRYLGKQEIDTVVTITGSRQLDFYMKDENFRLNDVVVVAQTKAGGTMSDIYASKLKQDLHGDILCSGGVSKDDNNFIKVGSAAPKYTVGFRNSFAWKGLELNFLLDARVGGVVVSATQALMDQFGVSKQTADARDNGGVRVNNGKLNAEQYYSVVAGGKTGLLAHYAYSATNVRLRELSLSYDLPASWFRDKLRMGVSLTAHNLFMIYNKAPFDPELTANTGTYYQGFDYFMPPSLRSLGFGLKVNF